MEVPYSRGWGPGGARPFRLSHTHTLPHTAHRSVTLFLSFSPVSSPSSSLSLPFFDAFSKTHPSYSSCFFFFFQHSCSWISKDTWPAEKAECLAGRSLSQAGWDCGIPASHSLGTVFAPSGAPAITASGLLLHLHLQPWARALFANWAWQKIAGSRGEERSNVWDGAEQQQLPVVASVYINYHLESSWWGSASWLDTGIVCQEHKHKSIPQKGKHKGLHAADSRV